MRLSFSDSYFEDEVRSDFSVPSMMKRAWAAELKVLKLLEDFFDRLGICYYAEYGTLLGAVRHQGFIPWDDDIDIALLRKDFDLMIAHSEELPAPLRLLSVYHSDAYYTHNAVATNNHAPKLEWDEERIRDFYGCPYIINLDINPLDYIPRDPELRKLQKLLYYLSYSLTRQCVSLEEADAAGVPRDPAAQEEFDKQLLLLKNYLQRFFGSQIRLDEDRPIRNALCRVSDRIAALCSEGEADLLDYYPHMVYSEQGPFRKKEWYRGGVAELPFETTTVRVSADYREQILAFYGENYMTPIRNAQSHEYPFYRKQEEYFRFLGHDI